jgi:hypothetical protein
MSNAHLRIIRALPEHMNGAAEVPDDVNHDDMIELLRAGLVRIYECRVGGNHRYSLTGKGMRLRRELETQL